MGFEYFISKKTLKSVAQGKKVSKPIVRISIISIALAIIVNLITIAVVFGFQQEVRQKISGFGSHLFIMASGENSIFESQAIRKDQDFVKILKKDAAIKSIQAVGYKPVLLQSDKNERKYKLANGKDTSEIQQDVLGAIVKGVDEGYDWNFFKTHLIEGKLPHYKKDKKDNRIVVSNKICRDLNYKLHDTIGAFFVKSQPVKREFIIVGIYETGLEEFDKKFVLGDLKMVQELNDWGISAAIEVADTLTNNQLIIRGNVAGGNGNFKYDWGDGFDTYTGFTICPIKDTLIRLIAADYWSNPTSDEIDTSIPDTAYLKISIKGNAYSPCDFKLNEFNEIERTYLNDDGTKFSIQASQKTITFEITNGKGSSDNYVGGFEIMINDWSKLDEAFTRVKKKINFIPTKYDELLKTTSIMENQKDIFVWLDFLDINVVIILSLMILIGIINMGSALLVLILIRSNFIGMMKAMGATNWSIRKIFLIQAAFLISRGMLWGNIIGLGICFIQKYTGVFTLNAEVYYLTQVPIELNFIDWTFLNLATLGICISSLIIPSVVITRIKPVKSIKFN
ncbi:MAG: FtsX-like permease family protein [Crocinitomicaceae bacterium]